jgi:hypothetical protein
MSAITKTGTISAGTWEGTSIANAQVVSSSNWNTAYTHSQDNTQAHTDYLLNSGNDTMAGVLTCNGLSTTGTAVVGDHGAASAHEVVNILYGTAAASPVAASATTIGTLYVQYTA